MSFVLGRDQALAFWHDVTRDLIADAHADLSVRQMALLLTIYLEPPPHTVRGLAQALGVAKPVVTRALDSLGKLDLVARRRDDVDRRNVIVQRTVQGEAHLGRLAALLASKAAAL